VIDSFCSLTPGVEIVRRAFRVSGRDGAFPQSAHRSVSLRSTGGFFMTIGERFWAKVKKTDTCWLWTSSLYGQGRYGKFFVGNKKSIGAHRFSYMLNKGSIPCGLMILHTCDVPSCVNPEHLYAGTSRDNERDAIDRGRIARRETHGMHKLTDEEVREIRKTKRNTKMIALKYGISITWVKDLRRGNWWHDRQCARCGKEIISGTLCDKHRNDLRQSEPDGPVGDSSEGYTIKHGEE